MDPSSSSQSLRTTDESEDEEHTVRDAVRTRDWDALKRMSLKPRGFGQDRESAWQFLLHAEPQQTTTDDAHEPQPTSSWRRRRRNSDSTDVEDESSSSEKHPDEHQIKLDTDRSFVLYPSAEDRDREELQEELNELITSVFRRRSKLSYYQGYHDIITVFYLSLPTDKQLDAAEKMSLHRLRDSMGVGLEPLIGQLRILQYLLRLADRSYSDILERTSPLPYFALSNLLTLFAHDVPTLELIQHIFDFLLCRPPIAAIYFAAVLTLHRKEEAEFMEQEGEEGMLHSLLCSLPSLYDSEGEPPEEVPDYTPTQDANQIEIEPQAEEPDFEADGSSERACSADSESTAIAPESDQVTSPSSELKPDTSDNERDIPPRPPSAQSIRSSHSSSSTVSHLPSYDKRLKKPVSLPALLAQADDLYTQYPPSHPDLHVSAILGPKSVIFTWSEDPSHSLDDAEAEGIVQHPELIVLHFEDPDVVKEKEEMQAQNARRLASKRKKRRTVPGPFSTKTVVAGAVVALGVAVAVYSVKQRGGRGPELRRAGQWLANSWLEGNVRLLNVMGR